LLLVVGEVGLAMVPTADASIAVEVSPVFSMLS
jgi:hypothetical protein